MSERIRELADQCNWASDVSYGELTKFSKLIVKECCDVFVELRTRPADLAVLDVKKHFGVDE